MNVNISNTTLSTLFPDNGFIRWKLLLEYLVCQLVARARADTKYLLHQLSMSLLFVTFYCFSLTYLPAEDN